MTSVIKIKYHPIFSVVVSSLLSILTCFVSLLDPDMNSLMVEGQVYLHFNIVADDIKIERLLTYSRLSDNFRQF